MTCLFLCLLCLLWLPLDPSLCALCGSDTISLTTPTTRPLGAFCAFELALASCTPLVPFVPFVAPLLIYRLKNGLGTTRALRARLRIAMASSVPISA